MMDKTKIGKYEIIEKIGEGGFGTVYKAHDSGLDRFVALKVLHARLSGDGSTVERFRQEARQAAQLKHPNIVTIYEVGEMEGRYYLVMEYLDATVLHRILKDQGALNPAYAVKIIKQIAAALDYAHDEGLIHRDVKPSNILVDEKDHATLTDFGIARAIGASGITTTGVSLGTPHYMAPEQIQGERPGPYTDIYALGVVAFQLLTGQVPFDGPTDFAIKKGHTESPPPDPREINPKLGDRIAKVLFKALEKSPQARFPDGQALVIALEEAISWDETRQWEQLHAQGFFHFERQQFREAEKIFSQMIAMREDADIEALFQESSRRRGILETIDELNQQKASAESRLQQIAAAESWLQMEARVPAWLTPSTSDERNWAWLTILIFGGIFLLAGRILESYTLNMLVNAHDYAGEWFSAAAGWLTWSWGFVFLMSYALLSVRSKLKTHWQELAIFGGGGLLVLLAGPWVGKFMFGHFFNQKNNLGEILRWISPSVVWSLGLLAILIVVGRRILAAGISRPGRNR